MSARKPGSAYENADEYTGITAGSPLVWQCLENVMRAMHHFSRARSTPLVTSRRIFSNSEKQYLQGEGYGKNLLEEPAATPIVNYIVWRRSALGVLVVLSLLSVVLSGTTLWPAYKEFSAEKEVQPFDVSYERWRNATEREFQERGEEALLVPAVDLSFYAFSRAYRNSMMDAWAHEMVTFKLVRQGIEIVLKCMVLGCVVQASCRWQNWRRSGWWIKIAWILAFAAPFSSSLIPLRAVTSVTKITQDVPAFLHEVKDFYNLEDEAVDLQAQVLDLCRNKLPQSEGMTKQLKASQERICGLVMRIPKIDTFFMEINPDPAQNACHQASAAVTDDNIEQAFATMTATCDSIVDALNEALEKQNDLYSVVKPSVEYVGYGIDAAVGTMNAIMSSKGIYPAAMSLGPGLLQGALRAKAIVPEASVSGVFVILLPLVYAPFSWLLCNLLVQFSGNLFVLGALVMLAFSPLGTSAIGYHFGVNSPMTGTQHERMTRVLRIWSTAASVVTFGFVLATLFASYRAFEDEMDSMVDFGRTVTGKIVTASLEVELEFRQVLTTLVMVGTNFLFKLEMVTVASTDLMLQECAFQRQFENLFRQADTLAPAIREVAEELEEGRTRRLTALVIAFGGSDERHRTVERWFGYRWREFSQAAKSAAA